jgi:hypothetical protein
MSKKLITTICMTVAFAAIPVASAEPGPPAQGGGCNMVFGPYFHSPNSSWLEMMAGSAGSANGIGAANMADMQTRFSDLAFCLG